MVLTHEDASDEEKMPYLAFRCHPLVVKEFYGRACKRQPPCPPSDCIWWWWKDLGLTKARYDKCRDGHVNCRALRRLFLTTNAYAEPCACTFLYYQSGKSVRSLLHPPETCTCHYMLPTGTPNYLLASHAALPDISINKFCQSFFKQITKLVMQSLSPATPP